MAHLTPSLLRERMGRVSRSPKRETECAATTGLALRIDRTVQFVHSDGVLVRFNNRLLSHVYSRYLTLSSTQIISHLTSERQTRGQPFSPCRSAQI